MSNEIEDWLGGFFEMNPDAVEIEEIKAVTYKNDLFGDVLPALDRNDRDYYSNLSADQQVDLEKSLWIIMRYMSSSKNNSVHHLMMVNDCVNVNFSLFTKKVTMDKKGHPELLWKLLTICGTGVRQFHEMIPSPKGIKKDLLTLELLKYYPLIKDDDIALLLEINTKEDLRRFFKNNGYDDKTIKELLKGKA